MLKEKLCYTAYDVEQEQKLALETTVLVEPYVVRVQSLGVVPNLWIAYSRGKHSYTVDTLTEDSLNWLSEGCLGGKIFFCYFVFRQPFSFFPRPFFFLLISKWHVCWSSVNNPYPVEFKPHRSVTYSGPDSEHFAGLLHMWTWSWSRFRMGTRMYLILNTILEVVLSWCSVEIVGHNWLLLSTKQRMQRSSVHAVCQLLLLLPYIQ